MTIHVDYDKYRDADGNMDWDGYYEEVDRLREQRKIGHRDNLEKLFKHYGITTVSIGFSGGNDDGGVDSTTFYDADGEVLQMEAHYTNNTFWNPETKSWGERELSDEDRRMNEFIDLLEAPIQDRWGSWAGDFYADGRLIYNLNETPYFTMEFQESSYEYFSSNSDEWGRSDRF